MTRTIVGVLAVLVLGPAPGWSQSLARFTVDSVLSIDEFQGENASNRPNIIVDISATVRIGDRWQVYVRPWIRQPRSPAWDTQIYQAAMRYEQPGMIDLRVDAGYIASPIGLGMFDTRTSVNPTIAPHFNYVTAMPSIDSARPRVLPVAATYLLGAALTLSTDRWDARTAIVNSAPTRTHVIHGATNPKPTPVFEAGTGVTPTQGLRFGMSFARDAYATDDEPPAAPQGNRMLTLLGLEGEYAFGYTKISGELIRDHFTTTRGDAIAYAWFVQGTQTLSPRWFVAARQEGTSAPPLRPASTLRERSTFNTVETTAGLRVTPEVTLRGSYFSRRVYGAPARDDQVGVSIVWAHRWW